MLTRCTVLLGTLALASGAIYSTGAGQPATPAGSGAAQPTPSAPAPAGVPAGAPAGAPGQAAPGVGVRGPSAVTVQDLAFIAGSWVSRQGELSAEEHWLPPAGGAMLAVSRWMNAGKMVMFEFSRIEAVEGVPTYFAQPRGRPPTLFALKSFEGGEAVFENPGVDFPQRIRYRSPAKDRLHARIEGVVDGQPRGEDFFFERAPAGPGRLGGQ